MLFLILINVCIYYSVDSVRTLAVFPIPAVSHQVVFVPLTQEFAKQGHDVVVITTDPAFPKGQTPENLTEIDVHDISYKIWRERLMAIPVGKKEDLAMQLRVSVNWVLKVFLMQMQTDEIQKIINDKSKTFDLLLIESCVRPALLLTHFYKVPTIQISSFSGFLQNYKTVGAPTHPLMYPLFLRQRLLNLTFLEKISEVYKCFLMDSMYKSHEKTENQAIWSIFGNEVPTLSELRKNVDMLFLNVHPIWNANRPVPPTVVYMSGVHQKPKMNLPTELESYLSSSKHGVIYVSFGSSMNSSILPSHKIQVMVDAFSRLPYDFIWKWDANDLPGKTNNIKIFKWLPQFDLLKHSRIKLFITQAGLQSTDEAIIAGVPFLGIPIVGDQWFNAEKYVQFGLGLKLDMETLTSEELKKAIKTIVNDESYRQNVVKLRTIMYDQPQKPLERVVWWTQHILQHGVSHLRPPAAGMSWSEYIELELLLELLTGLLSTIGALALLFFYVVNTLLLRLRNIIQS